MSATYEGYGGTHCITPGFIWEMDVRIRQEHMLKALLLICLIENIRPIWSCDHSRAWNHFHLRNNNTLNRLLRTVTDCWRAYFSWGSVKFRNGSYAGWLISSWWCAPHIFCMASSCSLTICIIINSMIPVPYILLYSYLRSIYYFRMRINLTPSVLGALFPRLCEGLIKMYIDSIYKT